MKKVFTLQLCLFLICLGGWNISNAQIIDNGGCPVATISYPGSPYCSDAGAASVSIIGTRGGNYTSDPGLVIDPLYGFVDLGSSTPGTYTVTYTIPGANGCPDLVTTTEITVTQAPTASFYYSGSPFCSGAGIASVSFNGTTGGIFSADPGLSIDPNSGDINLELSIPGDYTVSYSVNNGNCSVLSTAAITVSAQPNATITYAASPYCSTAGIANVNLTGTTGGVFSADPGLIINGANGDIDLAASEPGSYTISYYIAPAGNCGDFTTNATITILSGAKAQYSYPNSPYCSLHDTAMIAFSGTAGGTFSADPGLTIDPATGTVDIQASTPGTYYVYYNLSSSCGLLSNSTSITIDPLVCHPITHLPPAGVITIFPNPVTAGIINLQLTGMTDGMYSIKLLNENGVELLNKQILFKGGNGVQQIEIPKKIIKGYYRLEILQPSGITTTKAIIIAE